MQIIGCFTLHPTTEQKNTREPTTKVGDSFSGLAVIRSDSDAVENFSNLSVRYVLSEVSIVME